MSRVDVGKAGQAEELKDRRSKREERPQTRKRDERREKREERRAKREERREKRKERREKREEIPEEAARDPQMRPQKVQKEIPRGLLASWRPDRVRGRDGEERVRSLEGEHEDARGCFPSVFFRGVRGGVFPKDCLILRPSRWLAVAA